MMEELRIWRKARRDKSRFLGVYVLFVLSFGVEKTHLHTVVVIMV